MALRILDTETAMANDAFSFDVFLSHNTGDKIASARWRGNWKLRAFASGGCFAKADIGG